MRHILIIEDEPAVQQWFANLVRQAYQGADVRWAKTRQAAEMYVLRQRPDLALMNVAISGDGGNALRWFRQRFPDVPVAVICDEEDVAAMASSLASGAIGSLPRTLRAPAVVAALQLMQAGCAFLPPQLMFHIRVNDADELADNASELTLRQRELLRYILKGHANTRIARELGISVGTVKQHVNAIFKAIGVSSRAELLALAVRGRIRRDGSPITDVV